MRRFLLLLPLCVLAAACNRGGGVASHLIKVGASATGSLADQDPMMRGNRGPYQVWTLRGKRGQRLMIDMTSSAFDTYLFVRDADGYLIGSDDDAGDQNNARLRTILPRNGNYRIIATSFGATARGDYTLAVSEWPAPQAPRPGVAQAIAVGETKDGLLEPGDEFSGDGPYQDRWTFELKANDRVRIEMRSTDVDSYLMLLGPDGHVIATNDDANGRDAAITVRATAAGRYTAFATTYGDQPHVGAYRIALTTVSGDFADPGTLQSISDGETKLGQLEAGDSATSNGGYTDIYQFRSPRSGTVTLGLTSTELDPFLTLQDSAGTELTHDDDSGEGTNALITYPVTGGALYRLVVGTYGSGTRTGGYQLTARVSP
jgi:hypothetical protein